MKYLALSFWVSMIVPAAMAAEQVYKCTDATGKVVYQKQACEPSQRGEEKQIDPDRNAVKMEIPPPSAPSPAASATSKPQSDQDTMAPRRR
jgi:hypothetical protein